MHPDDTSNTDRLLGRVEQAIINLNETMKQIAEEQHSHGQRIGALEQNRSWLRGAGYVVVAIATWVAAHMSWPV